MRNPTSVHKVKQDGCIHDLQFHFDFEHQFTLFNELFSTMASTAVVDIQPTIF